MRHIRTALALVLGVAAFAVPTAGAALDPGLGNLPGEPGVFLRGSVPGDEPGIVLRRSAPPLGYGTAPPPAYRGPVGLPGTASPPAAPTRSSLGFKAPVADSTSPHANVGVHIDWVDAGIGAGFALGVMALLGGAALVTRHLGRPATA